MSEGKKPETTREIAEDICMRMDIFPETSVRFIEQRIIDAQQPLVKALEAAIGPLQSLIQVAPGSMPAELGKSAIVQIRAALTAAGRKP